MNDEETLESDENDAKPRSRILVLFLGILPSIVFVGYTFVIMGFIEFLGESMPDVFFSILPLGLVGIVVFAPVYLYFGAKRWLAQVKPESESI